MRVLFILCPVLFIVFFSCNDHKIRKIERVKYMPVELSNPQRFIAYRSYERLTGIVCQVKRDTPVYYLDYIVRDTIPFNKEQFKKDIVDPLANTIHDSVYFDFNKGVDYKKVKCFIISYRLHAGYSEYAMPYLYQLANFK